MSDQRASGHDARAVANAFLVLAEADNTNLSAMTLLKLIYFAHGWWLVTEGTPLIRNRFEAWKHGPVIRAVWDQVKQLGTIPVHRPLTVLDLNTGEYVEARSNFSEKEYLFFRSIFFEYGRMGGFFLSNLTHVNGSPWETVWNDASGRARPGMRISDEEIRRYFERIPHIERHLRA